MSISIQLALTVGQSLRQETLMKEIPGKGVHFDKAYLKAMSPSDRKTCYKALSVIERARLSAFAPDAPESSEKMKDRVRQVTDAVSRDLSSEDTKLPSWWKRPFLLVAKCVHSFFLWMKNTFFGRVSSNKLWNKVETYLNDVRNAKKRTQLLTKGGDGLIAKAEQELARCSNSQKQFLEQFKTLVEVHETLRQIDMTMAKGKKSKVKGTENFRQDLQNAWIVDGINANVIPYTEFKNVIANIITKASHEVQMYLADLLDAAQSADDNEDDVIQLLTEAGRQVTEQMQEQFKVGDNQRQLVANAHKHLRELREERELLSKKYPE